MRPSSQRMTTQDSQRLRGETRNMGLEPEDLGLNFTVTTSLSISSFVHHLEQQSPTSLAPGTSFMEDNFSTDQGWRSGLGMIQVHYIYCALLLLHLLLLHRLHLRLSGIRSLRWGTPNLEVTTSTMPKPRELL